MAAGLTFEFAESIAEVQNALAQQIVEFGGPGDMLKLWTEVANVAV